MSLEPFASALQKRGLSLTRGDTTVLQINVGLLCNQACRHCHLEAGPNSHQMMDAKTAEEVLAYAARGRFLAADITGGAPELNPSIELLISQLASTVPRVVLRSNLTAFRTKDDRDSLIELCREKRVVIVGSLPAVNEAQTDSMRGKGVWEASLATLRKLNSAGYGKEDSGLELHLVSNPVGAFLPGSQSQVEKKFKNDLERKSGIVFNSLFTFANAPLGRFRHWLEESGNFESYMARLSTSFNPCTIEGLMCRTLVSVSWQGYLFDCDFNLSRELHFTGRKVHVSEMDGPPSIGTPIVISDHCYACTAGSGFT